MARSPKYLENLLHHIRRALASKPLATKADLDAAITTARAQTGGQVRAAKRAAATGASGGGGGAAAPAAGVAAGDAFPIVRLEMGGMMGQMQTGQTPDPDDDDEDEDEEPMEGSAEDCIEDVSDALDAAYGEDCYRVIATFDRRLGADSDHVVFVLWGNGSGTTYWDQQYVYDEKTDTVTLGQKTEMERQDNFVPVSMADLLLVDAPKELIPANLGASDLAKWRAFFSQAATRCTVAGGSEETCFKRAAAAASNMTRRMGNVDASDAGALRLSDEAIDAMLADVGVVITLAATTGKAWDGAASRYKDTAAYARACLINENTGPEKDWTQDKAKLPVYEPSGELNLNALRAAAAALGGARGGIKGVSDAAIAKAKAKVTALEKQYKIGEFAASAGNDPNVVNLMYAVEGMDVAGASEPPANVRKLSAKKQRQWCEVWNGEYAKHHDEGRAFAAANSVALDSYDPYDDPAVLFTNAALRLADVGGGSIPAWQQVHKLGEWAEPHASGQKIQLTRAMGDTMIANFRRGVVRRGVPLDVRHGTDQDGEAIAWMQDLRWGNEGEGLPGAAEPAGVGPLLYGKFKYNTLGVQMLSDERFKHLSPQYHLDYVDKESGKHYGPAVVACAATNNPFLRVRSLQGEPAPAVVLSDGLIRPQQQGSEELSMADQQTVIQLQEQLESEKKARQAIEARLHAADVDAYLSEEIHKGLPPAVAKKARGILLTSATDAPAVISLSDDPAETKVNLHAAVKSLLTEIPRIPLGVATPDAPGGREPRPGDGLKLADEQISAVVDQLFAEAGLEAKPKNPANAGQQSAQPAQSPAAGQQPAGQ